MANGKLVTVYTPLLRRPLRFVVHRRISAEREVYELHRCKTLKALLIELLTILSSTRPDFAAQLQKLDDVAFQENPHKMRRYFAEREDLLYINAPHLTKQYSVQLLGGWLATNIGRKETGRIIALACRAAGVERKSLSTVTW